MNRSARTRLRALVALAADAIAPAWPLDTFVAVNPLLGFEDRPFDEATLQAAELFRARTLPGTAAPPPWDESVERVNERLGAWLAAYCDRGAAAWPMPHRERGFYAAWRLLTRARALPERADDALLENLVALGIPDDAWNAALQLRLAQTPGWAGYVKRAAETGELPGLDLIAMLAVRTWYERSARPAPAWPPPLVPPRDPRPHRAALAALEERERAYRDALLAHIAAGAAPEPAQPQAQFVFCIDARSEPLRRAIEAAGPYQTFGFAGFFGVPVRHRPFGSPVSVAQAPVLVQPTTTIGERPAGDVAATLERRAAATRAADALAGGALGRPVAAFAGVEAIGPVAALRAALATFVARRRTAPRERHALAVDALAFDERVFFAEALLRIMGLCERFAPLVVLCGHGGATVNNAFAAALDCGACGGNRGELNARVAAAILNDPGVRGALAERGIAIGTATRFVAAEHDTTRDVVELCEAGHPEIAAMLAVAGARARATRAVSLPPAPLGAGDPLARATDWAQVRPEWGLARNAGIIIGPRALTRGLDLDGRCFLHSYDPHADATGTALEQILTAPLVVAEWINLQSFFACVDPQRFGSGDKVLQQPVGGFGVVHGNGGDLRPGLPWQSTRLGDAPYHEPLRLLAVVCAPPERIDAIVARQQVLQRLFDHRWVTLVAIGPDGRNARHYAGARTWLPITAPEDLACPQTV
jgi:uncharacterized protein YbcC (UPF0753/DUF2309 family)